uniref:Cytochrome c-type biogenesis protein cycL, putative n=1 Tax=Arundo donax TaxID=35708 RepID=A0A0A9HUC4_ARUDO
MSFLRRIATSACESSIDWLPHSVHRTLWLIFLARVSTICLCLTSSSVVIAKFSALMRAAAVN